MAIRDTYTKVHEHWEDQPSEETPVFAVDLEHIEQGIKNAFDNRSLKEIYKDDGIELVIDPDEDEESTTPIISITKASENEEGEADPQYIHKLDSEGNATFSGDVANGNGVSLNGLQEAINNLEDGGGGLTEVPIATLNTIGGVKPDGTTITIDADGTIHAVSSQELAESVLGGES